MQLCDVSSFVGYRIVPLWVTFLWEVHCPSQMAQVRGLNDDDEAALLGMQPLQPLEILEATRSGDGHGAVGVSRAHAIYVKPRAHGPVGSTLLSLSLTSRTPLRTPRTAHAPAIYVDGSLCA
jgi:hypothetical protein